MIVEHFGGVENATTTDELHTILAKRFGDDVNEFWLSADDQDNPCLAILVSGNLANVTYFPDADSAGLQSVADQPDFNSSHFITFRTNTPEEEIEVRADAVVSFENALAAALEFFGGSQPPTCIHWTAN